MTYQLMNSHLLVVENPTQLAVAQDVLFLGFLFAVSGDDCEILAIHLLEQAIERPLQNDVVVRRVSIPLYHTPVFFGVAFCKCRRKVLKRQHPVNVNVLLFVFIFSFHNQISIFELRFKG